MFEQLLATLLDAVYSLAPVRLVMGVVGPRWRPVWAAAWVVALVHIVLRVLRFVGERRARLTLVRESVRSAHPAATDQSADQGAEPTAEAAAATAEPVKPVAPPTGELLRRIPPRVLATFIGIASVVALAFVALIRPPAARDEPTVVTGDTVAPSAPASSEPAFAFRWRGGRDVDIDCVATFEVTAGASRPWQITVHVMDSSGAVIGRDAKRVQSLQPGLLVDFLFKHVECEEIESWQFQGVPR